MVLFWWLSQWTFAAAPIPALVETGEILQLPLKVSVLTLDEIIGTGGHCLFCTPKGT